jgi:hypothetical protein
MSYKNYPHCLSSLGILVLGFLLAVFNISQVLYCQQQLGCINEYWAQFWLTSFDDGYSRRAFLGQLMRQMIGLEIPFLYINFLGFFTATFILGFVLNWYFRQYLIKNWTIPCAMLMSGPSATLLFEVLIDPLQICFIILLPFLFIQRYSSIALMYGLIASVIMIAIHEASIFIFVPAIFLIYIFANKKQLKIKNIFLYTACIALLYAIALNSQIVDVHTMAIVAKDGSLFTLYKSSLPSFSSLLQEEMLFYFGSFKGVIYFFLKILRVTFWPLLFLCVVFVFLKDRKSLRIFLILLLVSSPLYLIAHDWGRFAIYSFLLSLICSFFYGGEGINLGKLDNVIDFYLEKFQTQYSFVALFPLLYISYDSYRIHGLSLANTIYILMAISLYILIRRSLDYQIKNRPDNF